MNFEETKIAFQEKRGKILFIVLSGMACLLCLLLVPQLYLHFVIAIFVLIVTLDYSIKHKKKNLKINKNLIIFAFFYALISLSIFLIVLSDSQTSNASFTSDDGSFEYEQRNIGFESKLFWYDHGGSNTNGEIEMEGDYKLPFLTSIYHFIDNRKDDYSGMTYFIELQTNIRLEDDDVSLTVSGCDNINDVDDSKEELMEIIFPINDTYFNLRSYYYGGNITIDGDENYDYYHFKFTSKINDDFDFDTSLLSKVFINTSIEIDSSDEEWGYTTEEQVSLNSILEDNLLFYSIRGISGLALISGVIFITFIITFVILFATAGLRNMKFFMIIVTMVCILTLLVIVIQSDQLPVIEWCLKALDKINWANADYIGYVKDFVRVVGMIVAVLLWYYSIGQILSFIWGLYYLWKNVIGGFGEDIIDEFDSSKIIR